MSVPTMDATCRYWFLTSTTYGTWLPGDARGFVSSHPQPNGDFEIHNIVDTAYDPPDSDWEAACRGRLKGEPIYLSVEQADAIVSQVVETAKIRRWQLYIISVMCNHFHALLAVPHQVKSSHVLRDVKAYSSRKLTGQWGRRPSDTWWTESGSRREVANEQAFLAVYEYILHQPNCLAQWKRELDMTVVIPRDG